MIFGMTPGPQFIKNYPDFFWGLVASMYLGNVMLLVLNLPLIPLWIKVLKIPFDLLNILILIFCVIGAYTLNHQPEDIYLLIIFGLVGFLSKKLAYEPAPLILAFILGPMIEKALRQSLIVSDGSFGIFISRPISAVFVAVTIFILVTSVLRKRRGEKGGMMRWDRISGLFGLLLGIFIMIKSVSLDAGGFRQPGPGFFPLFGAILLTLFSAILLAQCFLAKAHAIRSTGVVEGEKPRLALYAFLGVVAYAFVFEPLGFIVATFLLVVFLLRVVTPKKWWVTFLTAVTVSLSSYGVFTVLLKSELPDGILDTLF